MIIFKNNYNVPIVEVLDDITIGTSITVGTIDQFDQFVNIIARGGLAIVKARVGGKAVHGAMLCSPFEELDGVEVHTFTKAIDDTTPYLLFGTLVPDGTVCKLTLTATALA